jgi:dimethylhistidine N-methyltransferase
MPLESLDRQEILAGLLEPRARISPKYFYDALGSRLFCAITELDEYYPTRTEAAIVESALSRIAESWGRPGCTLIDLGAGDCEKASRLFEALRPAQYVAIDISAEFLRQALDCLRQRFPALDMQAVGADFSRELALPGTVRRGARLFFYPGSSIGNFTTDEARALLARLRGHLDADGGLLIGIDLVKDRQTLEAAYDDRLGVTAAFNLNVLRNANRIAGTDFDPADWRHVAFFDEPNSRIEMHLEARRAVTVTARGGTAGEAAEFARCFAAGERIHTENSCKYRLDDFASLLAGAGFAMQQAWTDPKRWFAVILARPATAA